MKATPTCPDSARLDRLRDGSMASAERTEIMRHVAECPHCRAALHNLKRPAEELPGPTRQFEPEGTPQESAASAAVEQDWQTQLTPSQRPGSLGKLGHYEVLELIGRGGMGVVLKGFDEKLQRVVAVKLLAPTLAGTANARKRFVREARAAAAVRDNHVVNIYDVDESGPLPFLVMEFIDGSPLDKRIKQSGPMAVQAVVRISIQIAEGLTAAHKQGLVHRDIKPGNIIIENDTGTVKLTDFGLARAVDDANLTQSGVISGTPMFMAPEQALGELVDHRADLFSLGSVMYAMCTGYSPFRATGSMAVIRRVCDDPHQPIREVNPDIPEALGAIIDKLLAKDREDRFNSAKVVAEQLRGLHSDANEPRRVTQADVMAETLEAPRLLATQRKSRLPLYLALGAVACTVLTAAMFGPLADWWQASSDSTDPRPVADVAGAKPGPSPAAVPELDGKAGKPPALLAEPAPRILKPGAADNLKRDKMPARFLELAGAGHADKAFPELVAVLGENNWLLPYGAKGSWIEQSPDGKLLAVPSNDTVVIFDTETGEHQRTLAGIRGQTSTAVFSPSSNELAVGCLGGDNAIRLFDVASGREIRTFTGSKFGVHRVAFAPDGRLLASVGGDADKNGEAIIWDVATGKKQKDLPDNAFPFRNVVFSPDGAVVATASDGARVRIWDALTGKLIKTLPFLPRGTAYGLAFSDDGTFLAGGNFSDTMVWSTSTWLEHESFKTPGEWLAFQASSHILLTGRHLNPNPTSNAGAIGVLYLDGKKLVNVSLNATFGKNAVFSLSPDGNRLFGMSSEPQDSKVIQRQVVHNVKTWALPVATRPVAKMAVSSDGVWLAIDRGLDDIRLWDLRTGQPGRALKNDTKLGNLQVVGFSPDSSLLAIRSVQTTKIEGVKALKYETTVSLWNPASAELVRTLKLSSSSNYTAMMFSPNGDLLAVSTSFDGKAAKSNIERWRLEDGQPLPEPLAAKLDDYYVFQAAYSPDGAWLAVSTWATANGKAGRAVLVLDTKTGEVVKSFPVSGSVFLLMFSGDGKTFAWSEVQSGGTKIFLLDVATWRELPSPPALAGGSVEFVLHPWARLIAFCRPAAETLHLWEPFGGQQRSADFGPGVFGKGPKKVAFTPEGSYLAVGDDNGNVSVLRLPAVLPAGTLPSNMLRPAPPKAEPIAPPSPATFPALPVPSLIALASKPSPADVFKRSDIPAEQLAKLGTGNNDAPKELVGVLGKVGDPQVVSLSLTGDGRLLATMGLNVKNSLLFDLTSDQQPKSFVGLGKIAGDLVVVSPDGAFLAMGSRGPSVELFELSTGKLRTAITQAKSLAPKVTVLEIMFNPDGSLLAIGDSGGGLKLWQVDGAERILKTGLTEVNRMAFSPDGKFLACSGIAGKDRPVVVFEVATGKIQGKLMGHKNAVLGLAWHPNGQKLASSCNDGTIRLWDLPTMKEIQALPTDALQVHGLAWHPSGDFLASGNHTGGTITLWDMRLTPPRFRVINQFPPDAASQLEAVANCNNDIVFTPEGRYLIAGNSDGTVSVLRLAELGQLVK